MNNILSKTGELLSKLWEATKHWWAEYKAEQERIKEEERLRKEEEERLRQEKERKKEEAIQAKRITTHEKLEMDLGDELGALYYDFRAFLKNRPKNEKQTMAEKYVGSTRKLNYSTTAMGTASMVMSSWSNGKIIAEQSILIDALPNFVAQRAIASLNANEKRTLFLISYLNLFGLAADYDIKVAKMSLIFNGGDCTLHPVRDDDSFIPPENQSQQTRLAHDASKDFLKQLLPSPQQTVQDALVLFGNVQKSTDIAEVQSTLSQYLNTAEGAWLSSRDS